MHLPDWVLVLGAGALALVAFVATLPWTIRPLLRVVLRFRYRFLVRGLENLPRDGAALLAANHVTWIDGFILAATCPCRGGALVNASFISLPVVRTLARQAGLIAVPFSGPRALRASIAAAREALDRGTVLALFPEAQLTRTGLLGPFFRGLEVIHDGREDIPVIPVYLDNLWGSLFSFSGGRFFRKWPQGWRRTVAVVYGPPVPPPITAFSVRQELLVTGVLAYSLRRGPRRPLETIDARLPHLEHPTLGPLTGSTADFEGDGIRQVGQKPGTVGHALPGVALRIVDDAGAALPPETEGKVEALVAGRDGWAETGLRGRLDRDGFLTLDVQGRPDPSADGPGR